MRPRHASRPGRRAAILGAVALLFLLAFLYVEPSLRGGKVPVDTASKPDSFAAAPADSAPPDAVIAIKVDVENEWRPIDVTPIPEKPAPTPVLPEKASEDDAGTGNDDANEPLDLGDAGPRKSAGGSASTSDSRTVPPRPVEITWPETSRLKLCIGRHVSVSIRVMEDGSVERVEPVDRDVPPECLRAALDAAEKIRFQAGTVDGKPAALWTRVRIDFEKRK